MEELDRQQHIPRIFRPRLLRTPLRLGHLLRSPLLELVFEAWLYIFHHRSMHRPSHWRHLICWNILHPFHWTCHLFHYRVWCMFRQNLIWIWIHSRSVVFFGVSLSSLSSRLCWYHLLQFVGRRKSPSNHPCWSLRLRFWYHQILSSHLYHFLQI